MKKIIVLAICVLGFTSCGSTARCGLAKTNKIETIKKIESQNEILEAIAE